MIQSAMTKRAESHSRNCLQDVPYRDVCWIFPLGMSFVLLTMSSILMNQQYMLNKVSLNRSTNKTRLCVDWLTKIL